jgi:putative transposase
MQSILKSILFVLAEATHQELARQVRYLKVENEILRSKLPRRIAVTTSERRRLVRFAIPLGRALRFLTTIVVADTMLRWIREQRRAARSGKPFVPIKRGRQRTAQGIRRLILKLGRETGWGYTRIMGELKKLEIQPPSRNTVKNILKAQGLDPDPDRGSGSWDEFLKRHAHSLWQCDFIERRVLSWRGFRHAFVLVFLHVGTRRVIIGPPTYRPNPAWVREQTDCFVRTTRGQGLRVAQVFHDADGNFRRSLRDLWTRHRVRNRRAPIRAPNTQAYVERFNQTLQQECWDHFFICGLKHLAFLTREFLQYYHGERPHQGLGNELIVRRRCRKARSGYVRLGDVRRCERLGGLLRHYERVAA